MVRRLTAGGCRCAPGGEPPGRDDPTMARRTLALPWSGDDDPRRCAGLPLPPGRTMSAGLFALLDDVALLAKAAAASVDDIGLAAGKASRASPPSRTWSSAISTSRRTPPLGW